ncbi:hypothetical protein HU200_066633 [Digitaria exilis]|uniref:Uncharacterized protein n=1 Tax=Digitaria exilis TaxID=1010633 RepID=A0A835DWH9_9POAL|nr:hypothetical protein HU200_066633 [Digitaria exilis]
MTSLLCLPANVASALSAGHGGRSRRTRCSPRLTRGATRTSSSFTSNAGMSSTPWICTTRSS